MKYILGILRLLFGIGAIVVGSVGLQQHFGGYEKDLARLERLSNEGQKVFAEIDTSVLEIKVKGIKTYHLTYQYEVNGKTYKEQYSFGDFEELNSLNGEVTYLPSDPEISSLNLFVELEKARKEYAEDKDSSFGLWLGIGLLLFGLFHLVRGIFTFIAKPKQDVGPPPVPKESDYV